MSLISVKDMKIAPAWSIYFPLTENGVKMRTMILSFQQIGWSASRSSPLSQSEFWSWDVEMPHDG